MSEPNSVPNQVYSRTEALKKLQLTIQQLEKLTQQVKTQSEIPVAEVEAVATATQQLAASIAPVASAKPQRNFRLVSIILVTAIAATAAVFVYFKLQPEPQPSTKVVAENPSVVIEPEEISTIIGSNDPEIEAEIESEIEAEIESETESDTVTDEPEFITTPPELESPNSPEPVEIVAVPAPIVPTPEQSLIAAIQAQMQTITAADSDNIIQTIEPDFAQNRLIITVTEAWQQLSDSRRLRLANDILFRSRRVDFSRVEIVDSQHKILARSPVIGEDMILYDYSTSS